MRLSEALLERRSDGPHRDGDEEWEVVNSYNGGADPYLQSGQALHGNYPEPGQWRVRVEGGDIGVTYDADIRFLDEAAWPDPGQLGFKATSMKFWKHLRKYSKPRVSKLTIAQVRKTKKWQRKYDTIVVTNRVYAKLGPKLKRWVARYDGNLVLTDGAVNGVER